MYVLPSIINNIIMPNRNKSLSINLLVQFECVGDNLLRSLLHLLREAARSHVAQQDAAVDGVEGFEGGEAEGQHGEVALQSGVDGKAAGRRVHGGHVLHILDLLQNVFLPVVPVIVVHMLQFTDNDI